MNEDEIREQVERALRAYHAPPEMPREGIWAAIAAAAEGDGTGDIGPGSPRRLLRARVRVATALAASILLFAAGTGVGYAVRGGEEQPRDERPPVGAGDAREPVLYRVTWF